MQSKFSELFPIKGFPNLLFAQHCLVHCRAGGLLPRRIERPDIDGEDDVDNDGDDGGDDDGDDDMYIMMKCVCVCLSRKIITSHFRAGRQRREVSRPLGLAGRRPALA